ncbi:MAG: hypothetical protein ABSF69_29505 [Polyangiaceae bacterium]
MSTAYPPPWRGRAGRLHVQHRHRGIHAFYRPRSHPDCWDINVRCLDDPEIPARFVIKSFDGRNWEAHIDEIR